MTQILVKGVYGETKAYPLFNSIVELLELYHMQTLIPLTFLRASQNSKPVKNLNPLTTVYISLKILGGKGGFGSLLRGQGMIARVDNFDSCRDLNGRKIREVNNEIRLAEWKSKQEQKKAIVEDKQIEVKIPQKRNLPAENKYKNELKKSVLGVKSALAEGLKKRKTN